MRSRPALAGPGAGAARYGAGAIVGRRSSQQDTFLVELLPRDGAMLAIVADGMGGHAEGALASRLAAGAFRDTFLNASAGGDALRAAFDEALGAANRTVADAQRGRPERDGMGTTLLAIHLSPQGLAWISVGDSLLLVEADGILRRLNEDHSLRSLAGRDREHANMLRSAVSGGAIALVDRRSDPVRLGPGARIVVASDGLLTLSMDRLAAALARGRDGSAQAATDAILALVEQARSPKQDNCTVLVLDGPDKSDGAPPRTPLSWMGVAALGIAAAAVLILALVW